MVQYRRTILTLDDTQMGIDYMLFCVFEKLWPDMVSPIPLHYHPLGKNFNDDGRFDICAHVDEVDMTESVENDPLPHVKLEGPVNMLWGDMRRDPDAGNSGFLLRKDHYDIDSVTDLLPISQSVQQTWAWFDTQRKMYGFLGANGISLSKVGTYTQRYLGFNLGDNPLHIGCIYVVHYSPIKTVHIETVPAIPAVRCEIYWREGATREDVYVRVREQVTEKQSIPKEFAKHVKSTESFALVQMNSKPRKIDIDIENDAGERLHFFRDVVFLGSVISPVSRLPQKRQHSFVAPFRAVGLEHYLKPAILEKDAKNRRERMEFVFFDGDPQKSIENKRAAKECVKSIIGKAKKRLVIADPYLTKVQFDEYIAPLVNEHSLEVIVVNCKEQLEKVAHEQTRQFQDLERELIMSASSFNENINGNKVTIYCLAGQGRLHDRFILTEDEGWMIGSSLGEFGKRACSIIKLMDSAHMKLEELVDEWCADRNVSYKIE